MKINLGQASIDFQTFATQADSILGIRGGGKTFSATYLCEQLLDNGCPVTVVDPSGVWKNLKTPNNSGHGKGYDIIVIGGEDSDIEIDENFNVEDIINIVDVALENNASFIFDLYRSNLNRESWGRLLTLAFREIYLKNRGVRKIFIEEAATFIPQNQKAFDKDLYSVLEEITRIGGNAQLGITYVSQRAEQLNKQCLELCDLMILHRQRGNNSLKAIKKWLDMGVVENDLAQTILETLPVLKSGECWILEKESANPSRVFIPMKNSFHPDRKHTSDDYLYKSLGVSIDSVIEQMKTMQPVESLHIFSMSDYMPVIVVAKEETISVALDVASLTWAEKGIVNQAEQTPYGSKTVAGYINSLVSNGYVRFVPIGGFGYMENNKGGIVSLNSILECRYATLLLANL